MTIHNHPGGKPPSYRDIITAARNDSIKASIVVGHDGSVWYLSAAPQIADVLERLYDALKDEKGDFAESLAVGRLVRSNKGRKVFEWRKLR